MKDSDIIKQFREKFPTIRCVTPAHAFTSDSITAKSDEIESFILSTLHQYRQEVIEAIGKMKKEVHPIHYSDVEPKMEYDIEYHEQTLRIGYNQALSDIEALLKVK